MKTLSFGIFWIISDTEDLAEYKLLSFSVPCDVDGIPIDMPDIPLNSKSGTSYNHKLIWNEHVKNSLKHKSYNKKEYSHYPRGRVEISKGKAIIYLNPFICREPFIREIKTEFGLCENNISGIRIVADNSAHYACFLK